MKTKPVFKIFKVFLVLSIVIGLYGVARTNEQNNPLSITKDDNIAPDECVNPGDDITYIICYENSGNDIAYTVTIVDSLPQEVTVDPDDLNGGDYNEDRHSVSWEVLDIPAQSGQTCFNLTVQVDSETPATTLISNTIKIQDQDLRFDIAEEITEVCECNPILSIEQAIDLKVQARDLLEQSGLEKVDEAIVLLSDAIEDEERALDELVECTPECVSYMKRVRKGIKTAILLEDVAIRKHLAKGRGLSSAIRKINESIEKLEEAKQNMECSKCGDGILNPEEECDDGDNVDGDCCSADCYFESSGSLCGDPKDTECDNPDTCNGSGSCQANFEPEGTDCGICAACNGSASCEYDETQDSDCAVFNCPKFDGFCALYRDTIQECKGIGECAGSVEECFIDYLSSDEVCRKSDGACDIAENCTGSSADCPADAKSTGQCRPADGVCDVAEYCNGVADNCPADSFKNDTAVCRTSAGDCDIADYCTGSSADCPADAKSTAKCRDSDGVCDVAEYCNGVADDCPEDGFENEEKVCRAAVDGCDEEEKCTGSSADCPEDVKSSPVETVKQAIELKNEARVFVEQNEPEKAIDKLEEAIEKEEKALEELVECPPDCVTSMKRARKSIKTAIVFEEMAITKYLAKGRGLRSADVKIKMSLEKLEQALQNMECP